MLEERNKGKNYENGNHGYDKPMEGLSGSRHRTEQRYLSEEDENSIYEIDIECLKKKQQEKRMGK